ncbi:hypothetical protein [Streptomyces sp. NPDC058773]|uniref:hypothetical protein n=1 Tax=Streptomyces sp. NPDC058773 TaxID=3346632 RepID=UPI00367F6904
MSADIDTHTGIGAVWLLWRPKSTRAQEHTTFLEWHDERWHYTGGSSSSPAEDDPPDADVLEIAGCGGSVSHARRLGAQHFMSPDPYLNCAEIHLGPDVGHLLVGNRRIDAPKRRKLIVAWLSPHSAAVDRPVIVAFGRDGTELSRIGPHDILDTHTWARLEKESQETDC